MKEALQRIQTAVNDGVIDKESVNNSTANARDKFYSTDPSQKPVYLHTGQVHGQIR